MILHGHNGVIHEPHDRRVERYPASVLIGTSTAPRRPLSDYVALHSGLWPDQSITEACCSHAIRQVIVIRQRVMGIRIILDPSELDLYFRGRASRVGWGNVVDVGSNPVAVWEITRSPTGIVPQGNLPWDPMLVDHHPDPALRRVSVDWRDKINYHWVLSSGSDRSAEIDALLRSGRPVTGALTVDQGLLDWRPEDGAWSYRGPTKGYHYVPFTDVDDDGNYIAIGSWGSTYGMGGLHKIARSEVESDRCSYFATPEIRQ